MMYSSQFFDKKILAIDYGTKRIGLACSYGTLAEPLKIIPYTEGKPASAIAHIRSLCEQEMIELILVGISENTMARKTRTFIKLLKHTIEIPIIEVDETLTSQEARKKTASKQRGKHKNDVPVDHYAAALFLQEWLDTN